MIHPKAKTEHGSWP